MKLKIFWSALITLLLFGHASAQSDAEILQGLEMAKQEIRSRYQTSVSMIDISRMANDYQGMQLAQYELGLHEKMYNLVETWCQNPGQLRANPQLRQQADLAVAEYSYRTSNRDYRPYEQIQGNLQAWMAQRHWESSTPEGMAAYNNRQQQNWNNFYAHQNAHRQNNAAFDNYMNGLRADQTQRDKYHRQYVNTIHDRYEWVNPNTGNSVVAPNTMNAPYMQNPDGTYTQAVPYQNY